MTVADADGSHNNSCRFFGSHRELHSLFYSNSEVVKCLVLQFLGASEELKRDVLFGVGQSICDLTSCLFIEV